RKMFQTSLRNLLRIGDYQHPILRKQRRRQCIIHQTLRSNLFEFLRGILFEHPVARENPAPDWPGLFEQKIIFTDEAEDVRGLFRLVMGEFRKLHGVVLACINVETSDDANRPANRSCAAVSSGTKSAEFCASSNTSRYVNRSFRNSSLPDFLSMTM